jgi:hypothetical protein
LARRLILSDRFASSVIAARANSAGFSRLAKVAAKIPARLFFGHGIATLPVAASAARARGGLYGFDIEDFHNAETEEAIADASERRARHTLQSNLLPGAEPLTCAAPMIAQKYTELYGLDPLVVLNVFPRSQAPEAPFRPEPITEDRPARFYWFSQTAGPGRGLEAVIMTLGRMRVPAELHIRGFVAPDYSAHLNSVARQAGLRHAPLFLPPGPPNEMARLAATADMGLSVEESRPLNRDICLSNKIFIYLLAGIPQLLSRTSAQKQLLPELGNAALICDLDQASATAQQLDSFFLDSRRTIQARNAAWNAAQGRFCWDIEKDIFVNAMRSTLPLSM